MATLEHLMQLPGALAAFEFRGSGEVLDQRIAAQAKHILNVEILDFIAHMCAASMSIAALQSRGWERLNQSSGFYPVQEFALLGFDWSVVVSARQREQHKSGGNEILPPYLAVIIQNQKASYSQSLAMLSQ